MSAKVQTVHVRVNDAATGQPTPCRVRFTDADGTYYAPFGRLTEFATGVGEDVGGNLRLSDGMKWAYTDGVFEIALPAGQVHVEIRKGFEYRSFGKTLDLKAGQLSLRLSIERWIDARRKGWYSGDIHAEYLTPHAALLEAACEDLAVVNLLARETDSDREGCCTAIPNILAFSGQKPALEMPGHLVAVNTVNRHNILGEVLLLNCHRVVYPLVFGAPNGLDNWTLADWCDQCRRKGGMVVADGYHALAELVLGKVDAIEFVPNVWADDTLFPRRYVDLLSFGFRLPLVAGSKKASNQCSLGDKRTYAQLLEGQEFIYCNWIEAVRAGRTFVTNGPMIFMSVDGQPPGTFVRLDGSSQVVHVDVEAASAIPIERLHILTNDHRNFSCEALGQPAHAKLGVDIPFTESGWVLAYCVGHEESAQTSPVYVEVAGRPMSPTGDVLNELREQLNRLVEWSGTSGRFENDQQRDRLAGIFLAAKEELARRASR